MITIEELIIHLQKIKKKHPGIKILYCRYSDYSALSLEGDYAPFIGTALMSNDELWAQRIIYPDLLTEDGKKRIQEFLIFPGN